MKAEQLRSLQAPLKERYRADPSMALIPARAEGVLDVDNITCTIVGRAAPVVAGLHPAAGGGGDLACSADLLLEALVACAGVTLCAVATAMELDLRGGRVIAEGVWDARGTLGIDRSAPVGLTGIRLSFDLDTSAEPHQIERLVQATERYCVILQTLKAAPNNQVEAAIQPSLLIPKAPLDFEFEPPRSTLAAKPGELD